MNVETDAPAAAAQISQPDGDALYAEFLARAASLSKGTVAGADALLADIVASGLSEATFKSLAAAIAKATGLDRDPLVDQARRGRRALAKAQDDTAPAEPLRTREELQAACDRILAAPDVLTLLKNDLPALGIVGSGRSVLSSFIAAQSRHRPKPIHVAIAGPSGTGKSYELEAALGLISPSAIYRIGDGSEKFFLYDTAPLTGRVIYFAEATPLQRDSNSPLAYAIRTMMSEGVATYRYTDFDQKDRNGQPTVREIVRPGPAAVAITSTADKLHTEIETRLIRFAVDGSAVQTARILSKLAQDLNAPAPDAIIDEWRAFDELLARFGTIAVTVPFARVAVKALEAKAAAAGKKLASRLRRDFRHILTAIQSVAFLNQHNRQRDAAGRIVAGENDWVWTAALFDPALDMGALRALPQSAHIVFAELAKRSAAVVPPRSPLNPNYTPAPFVPVLKAPTRQLAVACGIDQATASRAVRILVEAGCLDDVTPPGRGQVGHYRIATPPGTTPGRQILPSWPEITAAAAAIAATAGSP